MTSCRQWEEDLALVAGGDSPSVEQERAALDHAAACTGCQALLAELRDDQAALASLRAAGGGDELAGLAQPVLARLATSGAPVRPDRASRVPRSREWAFLQAAAVVVLGLVAVLVAVRLPGTPRTGGEPERQAVSDPAGSPDRAQAAADADFRPVWVRRSSGEAIELTWSGDGRETTDDEAAQPYRVLASASPRDFSRASAVDVAGHRLVASTTVPTLRMPDRSVTFYKVQ